MDTLSVVGDLQYGVAPTFAYHVDKPAGGQAVTGIWYTAYQPTGVDGSGQPVGNPVEVDLQAIDPDGSSFTWPDAMGDPGSWWNVNGGGPATVVAVLFVDKAHKRTILATVTQDALG